MYSEKKKKESSFKDVLDGAVKITNFPKSEPLRPDSSLRHSNGSNKHSAAAEVCECPWENHSSAAAEVCQCPGENRSQDC